MIAAHEKTTSFKQLRTWQYARELSTYIYRVTERFPNDEKFGLTSQIRRSTVSVASNIAEGFSRGGRQEKINFYRMALGSLTETLSHAYIAQDLKFFDSLDIMDIDSKITDLHKMLNGMIKTAEGRNT